MVSCIRITSRNDATAKMPVRQVAPVVTTPRPVPVATHQHQRVSEVTTHTQAPRLKRQTPEEAHQAKRRADPANEVIKATKHERNHTKGEHEQGQGTKATNQKRTAT